MIRKILFLYSFILTFSLFLYGFLNFLLTGTISPILLLFFAPVFYFLFKLRKKELKILKFLAGFSIFLLLLIFLAGVSDLKGLFYLFLLSLLFLYFLLEEKREVPKNLVSLEEKVEDANLRIFLKTLGGVSVGFLLSSLLNPKQAGATFFGSIPGPGTVSLKDTDGTKINPAKEDGNLADIKTYTTVYGTNDIDEYDSTTTYVGKEDKDGNWVIQKIDTSSGTVITYATGTNNPTYDNYTDAWTNRESLTYSDYKDAF